MSNPTDPTDPAHYSGYADPAATPPVADVAYPTADPAYPAPAAPAPVLLTIGDMSITQWHVVTPYGTHPLDGTTWWVTDTTTSEEAVPQWAIICAIIGFFVVCVLSLLLLLVKETKLTGAVTVTVQGDGWTHATQLPPGTGPHAQAQAEYVRNLVAALPA